MTERARVVVRPFAAGDYAFVWEARKRRIARRPIPPAARRHTRRLVETSGEIRGGYLFLGIEADGRLVGEVDARQPRYGLPAGVYEIGIEIYAEEDRGKGYGGAAIEQLTARLLDDESIFRVQASTALDNAAMRRIFERLGYRHEGVLRGFMGGDDGVRTDYALYGITKDDWRARATRR
jgi:RimJ/RimL family protein N-acetyltransferase